MPKQKRGAKRKKTNTPSKPSILPIKLRQKERAQRRYQSRLEHYLKHRDTVGEAILRAALRCHATIEAGGMINNLLAENFHLDGVRLDINELNERAAAVMRAEVVRILASNSAMTEEDTKELTRRLVARLIPTRDNVVPGIPQKASPQERVEAIEAAMARESRRMRKAR